MRVDIQYEIMVFVLIVSIDVLSAFQAPCEFQHILKSLDLGKLQNVIAKAIFLGQTSVGKKSTKTEGKKTLPKDRLLILLYHEIVSKLQK